LNGLGFPLSRIGIPFDYCYFPCKFKELKGVDIIFISAKIELIWGGAQLARCPHILLILLNYEGLTLNLTG
jgi:hypothetical protein